MGKRTLSETFFQTAKLNEIKNNGATPFSVKNEMIYYDFVPDPSQNELQFNQTVTNI
jgi:hypothetical protein